ncbi:MAG: polyprenyl diphosphate synthase [Candidatus Gracilibacteria bacterium]
MSLDIQKPRHIAITPDGNRRWAREKGVDISMGHFAGYEKIKEVIGWANDRVIECLTIWGLSRENVLKRDEKEKEGLFKLINNLTDLLPLLQERNTKFINIGDIRLFPLETQKLLMGIEEETKDNEGMKLAIALGYSGLDEIIRAINRRIDAGYGNKHINETELTKYSDGGLDIPDPDLSIRTGIHNGTDCTRHSGIHLAKSTHTEYLNHKILWPDYTEEQFDIDLQEFSKTKRTKGK